jgi:outer membrane protein TolC
VLYLPLFDGGRLQRTLALTQARQREAGLNYRQTVLRAWHEVDDALSASNSEALRHQQLQLAQEQSEQALQVARRALEQGASDQHALLLAQSALLSSQSALTESRTAAGLALVALYRALGGGWPQSMDPSPAAVVGQSS